MLRQFSCWIWVMSWKSTGKGCPTMPTRAQRLTSPSVETRQSFLEVVIWSRHRISVPGYFHPLFVVTSKKNQLWKAKGCHFLFRPPKSHIKGFEDFTCCFSWVGLDWIFSGHVVSCCIWRVHHSDSKKSKYNWWIPDPLHKMFHFINILSIGDLVLDDSLQHLQQVFCSTAPRTYPPRFAKRIAKYYHRFCTHREGFHPDDVDSETVSALELFTSYMKNWDRNTWEDAKLVEMFFYLRGSKGLILGDDWRQVLPTTVPLST